MSVSSVWVRHIPSSAAIARRNVTTALQESGVSDADAADAAVIASELVSNAVRHAPPLPSGHLVVEWSTTADSYRIAVTDGGSLAELSVPNVTEWDTSGRGLSIITALATEWGVTAGEGTTTVWATGRLTSSRRCDCTRRLSAAG